jgi:flagellar M-ring protein FliF
MDFIRQSYEHFSTVIRNMSGSQMVLVVSLVAAIIVAGLFLFGVFKSVTYVTLYSDLDNAATSEILDRLEEMGVDYQISEGGSAVKVPSGDVYKARIKLAALGLPKSGTVGYSIFDKTNLGMTEFLQKVNYRRALEGELARSVMELADVEAARVHVVIPEEKLFEEDKQPATASVLVKLTAGGTLSKRQIKGISHLIASSVEGLSPENISIVDYEGNLLTRAGGGDDLAALSSTQLELRQNVERYLESKAQTLLDNSVGMNRSIVRVTAELDFDQVERTKEIYDPDNLAIRSEERTEESKSDASSSALDSSEANNQSTTESSVTNYEVNRTVERVVNSVGGIKKLTIAVIVDGNYEPIAGEDGEETLQYQPRSEDELNRFASIVKNAVGFDETRDDKMEILSMQFDNSDFEEQQRRLDEVAVRSFYMETGKKVLMVLGGIFLFFYGKKKLKKVGKAIIQYMPPLPPPPAPPPPPPEPPVVVQPQRTRLVDQMKKAAEDKPDEIARVIRTMMTE